MKKSVPTFILLLGLVLAAFPGGAADFTETKTFSSSSLTLTNLIGEVRVTGHRGSGFEVVVAVHGKDASRDAVKLETGGDSLTIVLPESKTYRYPGLGSADSVSFDPDDGDGGWLGALLGRSQIKVTKSGSGLEAWADVEIRVPQGGELRLRQGVGEVTAADIAGNLDLDSHHGRITAESIDGRLIVDTGSGDVSVAKIHGQLSVDTGSGDVHATTVQGLSISIDTGSGNVTLDDATASGAVEVDTGSGNVTLIDVSGDSLGIDTGSGDVDASRIRAESAMIDTGSGDVVLSLGGMGQGDFVIDTGSGGIQLGLPADASCRVEAESGSGGVKIDIAGIKDMRRDNDNEVRFTLGGGKASVTLDAGSGTIRVVETR